MNFLRIVYDDREKYPWVVYAGDYIYNKCQTHRGAVWHLRRLTKVLQQFQNAQNY